MRGVAGQRFRSPQNHANQEHPPDRVRGAGSRGGDLRQHRRHSQFLQVNAIKGARIFSEAERRTGRSLRTSRYDDDNEYVEKQTGPQARYLSLFICLSVFLSPP